MSPLTTRFARSLFAVLLALGILAGCGSESGDDATSPVPTATASEVPTTSTPEPQPTADDDPTRVSVPEVLRFDGRTVDGAAFEGATLAGRPTVFWFWAPWCPVCRGQIPQVQDLVEAYGDRVNVIGIGSLDSGGAIEGFAADADGITHLSDPDGSLWKRFRVAEQSSFVVLDGDGEEMLRSGYREDADVERAIEKALG